MGEKRTLTAMLDDVANQQLSSDQTLKNIRRENTKDAIKATVVAPLGLAVGLTDTVLQSAESAVNLLPFVDSERFSDEQSQDFFTRNNKQLLGFGRLYAKYQGQYQTTAEIGSLFVGAGAINAGVRGVSRFNSINKATNSKAGKALFGDFSKVEQTKEALDYFAKLAPTNAALLNSPRTVKRYDDLVEAYSKARLKQSFRENLGLEVVATAALNESDLLFPDGMKAIDYVQMAGLGLGVGIGFDSLQKSFQLRKLAGKLGESAGKKKQELNLDSFGKEAATINELAVSSSISEQFVKGLTDPDDVQSFKTQQTFVDKEIDNNIIKLGEKDSKTSLEFHRNLGLTGSTDATVKHLRESAKQNPDLIDAGVNSLDSLSAGKTFEGQKETLVKKIEKEIETDRKVFDELDNDEISAQEFAVRQANLKQKEDSLKTLNDSRFYGIDNNGDRFTVGNRQDRIWDSGKSDIKFKDGRFTNSSAKSTSSIGEDLSTKNAKPNNQSTLRDVTNQYLIGNEAITTTLKKLADNPDAATSKLLDDIGNTIKKKGSSDYVSRDIQIDFLKKLKVQNPALASVLVKKLSSSSRQVDTDKAIEALEFVNFKTKVEQFREFNNSINSKANARKRKDGTITTPTPSDLGARFNLKLNDGHAESKTVMFDYLVGLDDKTLNSMKSMGDVKMHLENFAMSKVNYDTDGIDIDVDRLFSNGNVDFRPQARPVVATSTLDTSNVNAIIDNKVYADIAQETKIEDLKYGADLFGPALGGADNGVGLMLEELSNLEPVITGFKQKFRNIIAGQEQVRGRSGSGVRRFAAETVKEFLPIPRQRLIRDVAGGAEADIISQSLKVMQSAFEKKITSHKPVLDEFRKRSNGNSRKAAHVYIASHAQGFKLTEGSTFGKTLIEKLEENKALLKSRGLDDATIDNLFKQDEILLPEISNLRNGKYVPVKIDKIAEDMLNSVNDIYKYDINMKNMVRLAQGMPVRTPDTLALPSMLNKGERQVAVLEVGSHRPIKVLNGKDAGKLIKQAQESEDFDKFRHVAMSMQDAQQYVPDLTSLSSKNINSIFADGNAIDGDTTKVLEGMLRTVSDSINNTGKSVIYTTLENEINHLRFMHSGQKQFDGQVANNQRGSVFNDIEKVLLNNPLDQTDTWLPQAKNFIDEKLDHSLSKMYEGLNAAFEKGFSENKFVSREVAKQGAKFKDEIGYAPAEDAFKRMGEAVPPSARSIVRRANALTGFMVLRMMDMAHATLTITTIPTISPAVKSHYKIRKNETSEQWRDRVGWIADYVTDPQSPNISPKKMLIDGMQNTFTKEGQAILEGGKKRGNLSAPVVEINKAVFGSGKRLKNQKYWDKLSTMLTKPTDGSEQFYRNYMYTSGYKMFKQMDGKLNDDMLHILANDFANKAGGDYRTNNKPELFRGTIGNALGLFQTFFVNYYDRIGRAVELGDNRTLFTQYASQASIFGVESLAGYDLFSKAWTNHDLTQSPYDSFKEQYGNEMSEVLLTGGLSSIPKFFGGEGISLYTRGDTNVRQIPSIFTANRVPFLNTVKKVGQGVGELSATTVANGGLPSFQRISEVVANSSPSRPVKGLIEIMNGYSTDRSGNKVTDKIRNDHVKWGGRLLGVKASNEVRKAEVHRRHLAIDRKRRTKRELLRKDIAARIRRNDNQVNEEIVNRVLTKYADVIGNPKTTSFDRFMKDLIVKARDDVAHKKLLQTIRTINSVNGAEQIPNDGEFITDQQRRLIRILLAEPEKIKDERVLNQLLDD